MTCGPSLSKKTYFLTVIKVVQMRIPTQQAQQKEYRKKSAYKVMEPEFDIDALLENEHQNNKKDSWNKLNKTTKLIKLLSFAEKYGNTHHFSEEEIISMQEFLTDSLETKKFQKTKDVVYDKIANEITEIPGLVMHQNKISLRLDGKRVSTLKSLTPKRIITEKID